MKAFEKTGSRVEPGMTKIWDWAHTPMGDIVIGTVLYGTFLFLLMVVVPLVI